MALQQELLSLGPEPGSRHAPLWSNAGYPETCQAVAAISARGHFSLSKVVMW
ncbi:MAG: hypothetical protein R2864_06160 [Syntrophotaleaceae bacterium]